MQVAATSQLEGSRFKSWLGPFCLEFVYLSPSLSTSYPQQSKTMHVKLIDYPKLIVDVRMHGYLSLS